jgi:hypothetical protein
MVVDLLLQGITLRDRELCIRIMSCDIDGRLVMGGSDLLPSRNGVIRRRILGGGDSRGKGSKLSLPHAGTGVLGVGESGWTAISSLRCHCEQLCNRTGQ